MKPVVGLLLFAVMLLCITTPPSISAAYCNRVQYFKASDTFCGTTDGRCDYRKFDFKRHVVGSCMSGLCMDGNGIGWVEHGVYFGKFRYGYPVGEGTMRRGYLDSSKNFIETLVLNGNFYDGCMKYDVTASVPGSGIYWEGKFDEESNVSNGTWYLKVTNPGHNVAPLVLVRGGLSDQPTKSFADEALRRENASLADSASSLATPGRGVAPSAPAPEPRREMARPVPDENTQGPLPFPGDPKGDANNAFMYLAFPNNDRTAPLSPHMEALFRPVYARALQLYDSPDPEVSKQAASALSNLYERGWFVPKDLKMKYALSDYAYSGASKPSLQAPPLTLPVVAPTRVAGALPKASEASVVAKESKGAAKKTPFPVSESDYQATRDALNFLLFPGKYDTQIDPAKPLSPDEETELRPVFENLVRIYNGGEEMRTKDAGLALRIFYERGWIVKRDLATAKKLLVYFNTPAKRFSLPNLPPCNDAACKSIRYGSQR